MVIKKKMSEAVAMSTKIFTNLFHKNLKNPKHFHLYPSHRSLDKNAFFTRLGDSGISKIYCGELYKDHLIFDAIGVTEELSAYIGLAREYVRDDEKLTPLAEKLQRIQLVLVDVMEIVSNLQPKECSIDNSKPPQPVSTAKVTSRDIADLEALIAHYGTLLPPIEKIVIPVSMRQSSITFLLDLEMMTERKNYINQLYLFCEGIDINIRTFSEIAEKGPFAFKYNVRMIVYSELEVLVYVKKGILQFLIDAMLKHELNGGGKASAALHVAKSICRRCERILVATFKDMNHEKDLLAYINRLSTYLSQAARISAKFANRSETIYKPHVKGDSTMSDK